MLKSRRNFLSVAAGGSLISLSPAVPNFLLQASAAEGQVAGEKVLVVVQLSGGNDGLNTVIPYSDDEYYKNRPTLAVGRSQVHRIDDAIGFNPAMNGFSELLDEGQIAVIQGVGYPNPNRSHFESMDIWHTCRRDKRDQNVGWLGRYLDEATASSGKDVPAIHMGGEKQPLALAARRAHAPSIRSLDQFKLRDTDLGRVRETIQADGSPTAAGDDLLGFVRTSTVAAIGASQRIEKALKRSRGESTYPGTGLATKLRTIAQLIDAGLSTRIYYVSLGGFDTHSQQGAAHTSLLVELSAAVTAFVRDLSKLGHKDRVAVMMFSEFGRRVKENASRGTDHGAAAPMFLVGGRVKSGVVGQQPSLTDLQQGDLKHHTDFRRIYASVLRDWLGYETKTILGEQFEPLPVFAS